MRKTIEYLDAAKTALNIESDYEMAKKLRIQKQTMSGYRTGIRVIDDYAASRIAEALGIDPMEVIAAANAEREKSEERRSYWRQIGERFATPMAMAAMIAIGIGDLINAGNPLVIVMSKAKRRALARPKQKGRLQTANRRRHDERRKKSEKRQEIGIPHAAA